MSLPNELMPVGLFGTGAAASSYQIERSLRFNSSDSAYLSRTPASAGNRKTWTWAGWVKRSSFTGANGLFEGYVAGNGQTTIGIGTKVFVQDYNIISYNLVWDANAELRDPSAWYHICVVYDSTQASSGNAAKVYVNGILQTLTFTAYAGAYVQNRDSYINNTTTHSIGVGDRLNFSNGLNGYLADIHFIDGQSLDPTSFGEFDTNGIWQPKAYTGTYGTNGFRLDFADNASTTTIGYDAAGSNDWTANNLSVTAGAGNDSLVDVPTNGAETDTGAGGEVRGNYATGNPLFSVNPGFRALANGNLDWSYTDGSNTAIVPATIYVNSGKWYAEFLTPSASGRVGVINNSCVDVYVGQTTTGIGYENTGQIRYNGAVSSYGASWTANDLIGIALNLDDGTITFYKNGVSQGIARTGLTGSWTFAADAFSGTFVVNFGQRPFAYTAPSGFKALNTANLPAPVVTKPSDVMDVKLYTGNGSTQTISGLGFSPDLVWIKNRAGADNHKLTDIVRGATEELESNTTDAEATNADGLTQFNADGFDLGDDDEYNTSAEAYVAWAWDAGSSTVTNTSGSISSQVRANASAGFSVVTWTGNGASGATVGHGLGVAPEFFIVKCRNTVATGWLVYANPLGATSFLLLESTAAVGSNATAWNDTAPSSTTITLGNSAFSNGNTATYVAYCFAPVAGYSAFGIYTGNGSADGPFVYTGFRPAFVLMKRSDTTSDWWILDNKRSAAYNVVDGFLYPNGSGGEAVAAALDILSNGFKMRRTNPADVNANGGTYIYAAFAEHPFQYSRAR